MILIVSKSELIGINWNKGKWRVQISFQGKRYYLGRFDKIEDAIESKKNAEEAKNGDFLKWYQETYSERSKDLTGKDFGYIHVIQKEKTQSGKVIWECRCKCGNIIYLPTDKITSGHTQSCGCILNNMKHKSDRNVKCVSYEKGKHIPYRVRIMRYGKSYSLGRFSEKVDADNMALIARTFSDMDNFLQWYSNRKELYNWLCNKCYMIKIPCEKIIQAIYDGYYGELYNDLKELDQYIDDFKIGYET